MVFTKIKSHAKINLALNITGKKSSLHDLESVVAFISLYDEIYIKRSKLKYHNISFVGKFGNNIGKVNTIFSLLQLLDKHKLLKNQKFTIKVKKNIPSKAGLGGGSMNAASILRYFFKKKIIKTTHNRIIQISKLIGSDVVLGLKNNNLILTSQGKIKYFQSNKKIYVLIIKPSFGCSTKYIYSKIKKFEKPKLNHPRKKMFNFQFLKRMNNALEPIAFSKYPKLKSIKLYLESLKKTSFVRMTGSGSALVAYFQSKQSCESAKKKAIKKYKNFWCISSKTI